LGLDVDDKADATGGFLLIWVPERLWPGIVSGGNAAGHDSIHSGFLNGGGVARVGVDGYGGVIVGDRVGGWRGGCDEIVVHGIRSHSEREGWKVRAKLTTASGADDGERVWQFLMSFANE